jgi:hypothetical protein
VPLTLDPSPAGSRTVATGAFIARRVRVGRQVELTLDSSFE